MLSLTKQLVKLSFVSSLTNKRSYKGGIPGCNLPFRKSLDNPMRFTAFFLMAGVIGFGAPWLVVMHQMLRPYDYVVD
ncbi:cytochrome c oxidase subunit 7C-like [Cochliomyia hominivorax]